MPIRVVMGWRDRDWAKFDDDEWNTMVGSRPLPFGTLPPDGAPRGGGSATPLGALVVVGAVLAIAGVLGTGALHRRGSEAAEAPLPPTPTNVVSIRWGAGDVVPAQAAGRICVDNPTQGEVCASYVAGERPADVLTRRLEALGLSVQSAG